MNEKKSEKVMAPEPKIILESSPHIRAKDTTPRIMYRVILSLLPAVAASFYFFRWQSAILILVSVATALATESLCLLARRKPIKAVLDGSAVITGLLLALTLPPSLPPGMAIIGSFVAISLGKQAFGGLGHNIFNPALVGRAFLQAAFPVAMTTWVPPLTLKVDVATFATPLGNLKFQNALGLGTLTPIKDLFWGNVGGCLGETSAAALLLGALYLLIKKTIDWRIPVGIILTLSAFTGLFWLVNPSRFAPPHFHLLAGGLLLGAFFMA
ncbi:MAG: RnfABCDGE type electron transport complex subunit D, partial [Candidatus Aminicenantes bacterium]|nr:RnfABCDGE type electron transport complex subunit D [Candidatus Aminicenantes bacterium]